MSNTKHKTKVRTMKSPLLLMSLFFVLLFSQCIPPEEEDPGEINIKFADKSLQHVIDMADKQVKDSLLLYLSSESPTLRYAALKGFAAMKDSTVLDEVAVLLDDPIERIQSLAAYTIGLMGSKAGEKYLTNAFVSSDTISARRPPNEWVLEALGRCGDMTVLKNLASVKTFLPRDTALVNGQSKALYRFALRKMVVPEGTKLMFRVAMDNHYPPMARLYAAAYLGRTKSITFDANESHKLLKAFTQGTDQEKIFFAQAIQRTTDSTSLSLLKNKLSIEKNPSVKAQILRALSVMPYDKIKETFFDGLKSKEVEVNIIANEWIQEHGVRKDAFEYYKMAKDTSISQASRVALLSAGLKHVSRLDTVELRAINRTLRNVFAQTKNPYIKAKVLLGLAEFPWNYRFIKRESSGSDYKVVQVAGIEALDRLLRSDNYLKSVGTYRKGMKGDLSKFFMEALESGDVGKRAAAAIALRNPDQEFRAYVIDTASIFRMKMTVSGKPKDIESHNEILKTIAELKGTPYEPISPVYNHPIDWVELEGLDNDLNVTMTTTRGDIEIELFVKESPGTVANFVKEAKRKYYNNKTFHRVVPGFVIQGGCPRGDGYGSLGYTIRSEFFPYNYDDSGYIGMASAGPHTEGVQFFITHTATPHLDGNYTIFGKVTKGMDVVHKIGVGDEILTINFEK